MTKSKEDPLKAAFKDVPDSKDATPDRKVQIDGDKTVMIGGHFPKSYKKQLRLIAAEEDTTSQALLEEALNLLFVKKGKSRIS